MEGWMRCERAVTGLDVAALEEIIVVGGDG